MNELRLYELALDGISRRLSIATDFYLNKEMKYEKYQKEIKKLNKEKIEIDNKIYELSE